MKYTNLQKTILPAKVFFRNVELDTLIINLHAERLLIFTL